MESDADEENVNRKRKNDLEADERVNWKKCIICQENKFPKKKFPVSKGTEPGIQRIAHCADIRESGADLKYTNCARIANRLKEKGSNEVLWHRSCYSSFTNEGHIRRIQSNSSSSTSTKEEQAPASRRSSTSPVDWSKCMFCQTDESKLTLNNVQTLQTSNKILGIAASGIDEEISCKLGGVHDLVAAEGKYHLKCYASFLRKAKKHSTISQESNDQDTESIGHEEIDDHEVLSDNTINDDVDEDIDLNAELLSWLYRVGIKVHHDLKSMPGHDSIGDISQESAEKIIPDSLFTLVKLLCVGHQDDDGEDESSCKTSVLSICQDILFAASRGRKLTPKHVGLGLTIHQATRSKELVQLLYSAGHCVSYETVLRIDNTIASDVLEKYKDNGNVFVPRNFCEESTTEYTRYAVDNIDINEETLSGMGTFHATQVAAFRRKEEGEDVGTEVLVSPKLVRRMDAELPKQIHELEEIVVKKKPEPVNQEAKEDWYQSDKNKIKESNKKELSWLLGRLSQQRPELQKIPGWSGFNQLTTDKEQPEVTIVGPLPIVNAPAHEYETLWTVLRRCQAMTALRGGIYTVVTMDEGLYNKAKMLQWEKTEHLKNVVLVLGGFHTQMTFSKVIGQFLESSGISDIWVESEIFGETTAGNILRGKLWNRVIRAHKLTYEALWRVLWPIIVAWARDGGHDDEGELAALPAKLAAGFSLDEKGLTAIDSPVYRHAVNEMGHVLDIIAQFDEAHQHNPTLCYWRQYMLLVSILLRFTRAIREGDWVLYLSSIAEMLPWFAVFDHVNYFRWVTIFLCDMKALPCNAPEVHKAFIDGDFVTKETCSTFNQIPDDQALEHVNKSGKVAGGLVGITRTDSARDRWCLTYNERAQLSEDTKAMFGILAELEEGSSHKDLGKTRMKKDEDDVLKLVSQFSKYEVFRQTENLVVITTGDVASEEVKQDLLEAEKKGERKLQEFIQERLIHKTANFHDTIKQQKLKTFETLYTVSVPVGNSKKVIKADRDLLRRVVVALESGRDIDVDDLLTRELSPVPFSIATLDGCIREATGKSDLSNILQKNVSQDQPPQNQEQTCTIIDGMAAVQSLGNSAGAKTFGEWCDNFTKFVTSHFTERCTRVDLVFDQYTPNSIKGSTRMKRKGGKKKGIRKEVESRDQRIGNWDKFITTEENKRSLTNFVSTEISESYERHPRRELVVSGGFKEVRRSWSSVREDLQGLSSSQEEADTRIVLHARDATLSGYKQVNVICRDTDVLVLLLAHKHNLCDEVWMFSGTSRKKRFIPVHRIEIPEETRNSLLAFHAITGCDTTSQFCGIGKGSAWKALDSQTSNLLTSIGETSPPTQHTIADGEAFVCQLYHKGTREVEINRERAAAFRKVKKNIDSLPPTQDALHLHIRRANYQSMIWKRAQEACPSIPRPEDENGWYLNDEGILKPKLMTQEVVSSACIQLAFCGCSSEQSCLNRRCTCVRLSLPCSRACKCCDTNRCRNPENR